MGLTHSKPSGDADIDVSDDEPKLPVCSLGQECKSFNLDSDADEFPIEETVKVDSNKRTLPGADEWVKKLEEKQTGKKRKVIVSLPERVIPSRLADDQLKAYGQPNEDAFSRAETMIGSLPQITQDVLEKAKAINLSRRLIKTSSTDFWASNPASPQLCSKDVPESPTHILNAKKISLHSSQEKPDIVPIEISETTKLRPKHKKKRRHKSVMVAKPEKKRKKRRTQIET